MRPVVLVVRLVLAGYRLLLSPLLGPACRYLPTCSRYMEDAVVEHGPVRGMALGVHRLCRCHPWGGHGYDPVPPRRPRPVCSPAGRS